MHFKRLLWFLSYLDVGSNTDQSQICENESVKCIRCFDTQSLNSTKIFILKVCPCKMISLTLTSVAGSV